MSRRERQRHTYASANAPGVAAQPLLIGPGVIVNGARQLINNYLNSSDFLDVLPVDKMRFVPVPRANLTYERHCLCIFYLNRTKNKPRNLTSQNGETER